MPAGAGWGRVGGSDLLGLEAGAALEGGEGVVESGTAGALDSLCLVRRGDEEVDAVLFVPGGELEAKGHLVFGHLGISVAAPGPIPCGHILSHVVTFDASPYLHFYSPAI